MGLTEGLTERLKSLCREKTKKEELCMILFNTARGIGSRDWTLNTRIHEGGRQIKERKKNS